MRIAIISTPRSGNSWLRLVLAEAGNLNEIAVHDWKEAPDPLPDRCLMQIHWYREPHFQAFLKKHGFQVLTICRHPLDVMLSVLRMTKFDPMISRWLAGNCELKKLIAKKDAGPDSDAFFKWCLGFGCENLLSISYLWANDRATKCVHYESLVQDPVNVIHDVLNHFNLTGSEVEKALEKYSLNFWREQGNPHGWQGKPGHWKKFFTRSAARRIYQRHQRVFDTLGYTVRDASWMLTKKEISRNWQEVV